ncbi:hypothetical protein P3T76_006617 [Phytophthora citrophthora]|uniref:Uncharacterized protein n=1 Tax=Phytophthora citrophthora TaxID=4793 RepID=A0AAD9GPA8_9STRA|nr:hypothetical protein P3T76_006617 [Phytophthora citrophthora]
MEAVASDAPISIDTVQPQEGVERESIMAKFGLPFILDVSIQQPVRPPAQIQEVAVTPMKTSGKTTAKTATELTKEEKKRRRTCKYEGCHNYIVHKGLCCRHGVGPPLKDLFNL